MIRLTNLSINSKEEITMKRLDKSSKKGFTLVELIVVLVILAILAAMLVPALTGYIDRARQEKDYQTAATVLTAAQTAATYQYSKNTSYAGPIGLSTSCGNNVTVAALIGNASKITAASFNVSHGIITGGTVTINGYIYTWDPSAVEWTAQKA